MNICALKCAKVNWVTNRCLRSFLNQLEHENPSYKACWSLLPLWWYKSHSRTHYTTAKDLIPLYTLTRRNIPASCWGWKALWGTAIPNPSFNPQWHEPEIWGMGNVPLVLWSSVSSNWSLMVALFSRRLPQKELGQWPWFPHIGRSLFLSCGSDLSVPAGSGCSQWSARARSHL